MQSVSKFVTNECQITKKYALLAWNIRATPLRANTVLAEQLSLAFYEILLNNDVKDLNGNCLACWKELFVNNARVVEENSQHELYF